MIHPERILRLNDKPARNGGFVFLSGRYFFGKIRYMNAASLKRKCDIEAYVEKVKRVV